MTSAVPPHFAGDYPNALCLDQHPGLAVTGSPVPVYFPCGFFGNQAKRLRSG